MNKYVLSVLCIAALAACNQQRENQAVETRTISREITKEISSEILLAGDATCNYYDMAITADYYAFLDFNSDTLLQIRRAKDLSLYQIGMREVDTFALSHPYFVKYDYQNRKQKNAITIWNNDNAYLSRIQIDDTQSLPFVTASNTALPVTNSGAGSINCCLTKDETYAMSLLQGKPSPFFSDNPKTGTYHVPAFPKLEEFLPGDVLKSAYACDLVMNEEKGVIVAALRFISGVNFYSLNGDLTDAVCFGEYYSIPIADITGKYMDAERSVKSFIDICCSDRYIYCLYEGSTDFTALSTIVVFDWEGKHIANLRADRDLRKVATNPTGSCLLGLAANEQGGRDLVKYSLKGF